MFAFVDQINAQTFLASVVLAEAAVFVVLVIWFCFEWRKSQ